MPPASASALSPPPVGDRRDGFALYALARSGGKRSIGEYSWVGPVEASFPDLGSENNARGVAPAPTLSHQQLARGEGRCEGDDNGAQADSGLKKFHKKQRSGAPIG